MSPADVFAKEGADVFRLWVSAQSVGDEARWGRTALKQANQDLKDWRSFLRFMLANMAEAPNGVSGGALQPLDQLALHKAATARDEWAVHMAAGRYNQAMQVLNAFRLWASTEWFELNKRTLYCSRDDDAVLVSLQWSLQEVFVLFCRLLAPVLPFSVEEAYLAWPQHPDVSVFVGVVPSWAYPATAATGELEQALAWRRSLLPLVEKARSLVEKGVPVALSFRGATSFGLDEDALREWFPNTYPRLDGSAADFETHVEDAEKGVFAGRAAPAFLPVRCVRCRGYFQQPFGAAGLCLRCEVEMAD